MLNIWSQVSCLHVQAWFMLQFVLEKRQRSFNSHEIHILLSICSGFEEEPVCPSLLNNALATIA